MKVTFLTAPRHTNASVANLAKAANRPGYREAAIRILTALCDTCLTTKSTRAEAILARGTRHRPNKDGVEVSLPYGDYYLLDAILRVLMPREIDKAIDLSSV